MILPGGEVHLYFSTAESIDDPTLLGSYRALLNADEQARHQRIIPARVKQQFLVARALVRTTLSRYAEVAPAAWEFDHNEHNCPFVAASMGLPWLRFNLSHTHGLMVLAVARQRDVGVDVEDSWRSRQTVTIADRFFASDEVSELHALARDRQQDRFFDYWTLKESYIKARGMGLAIPLGKFAFHDLQPGQRVRVALHPSLGDQAHSWQFWLFSPTRRHRAALAVRRGSDVPLVKRSWQVVPLESEPSVWP